MKFIPKSKIAEWQNQRRISRLAQKVAAREACDQGAQTVLFFNASTRLRGLSLNAAFSLLTSWGLRLSGFKVVHFVCKRGMSHCVLGINRQDYHTPPPCAACIAQSERFYQDANVYWFNYTQDNNLAKSIEHLSIEELSLLEYPFANDQFNSLPFTKVPLGKFVLPSIRWTLRRHNLPDNEETRYLLREYILSAYNIAYEFEVAIHAIQPTTVVIFNGTMFPEATIRWIARKYGLRVITHEVGFKPSTAFFTTGEATAYPIPIPEQFELSEEQNQRLDNYLQQRFQGEFSMAGIQFWPEMRSLDENMLQKAARYRQIVPVFTNVIYDTSQIHANKIFQHMFEWLDEVLKLIHSHPETLFFIRAHPDEMRPGTAKQSMESVRDWVTDHGVKHLKNVVYIDSLEYISSYELIQLAKFIMVYNSSIGLEASIMGKPVLCGGKARYTQYATVFLPDTPEEFRRIAQNFLLTERIDNPIEFKRNARRFLYYQLYRASLPFEDYLIPGKQKGFVYMKPFTFYKLLPENSITMQVIRQGILDSDPVEIDSQLKNTFLMPDPHQESSQILRK